MRRSPPASAPISPNLAAYGDDGTAQAYVEALFALPAMIQWEREARSEIAARG